MVSAYLGISFTDLIFAKFSMPRKTFFTAGPSELYFGVDQHVKRALQEQIPSISHRSREFQNLYRQVSGLLKEFFGLPDSYHVLFLGSATEAWERILQSCVIRESCHLVNGAFSQKFADTANDLGLSTQIFKAGQGLCCEPKDILLSNNSELIALTHNETSTGAMQPVDDIGSIHSAFPDTLLAVDVVSSAPYINFDPAKVDALFFSVQKGIGLPAGLGILIVSERCLLKSQKKLDSGLSVGSYHSLPNLAEFAEKFQTPETPNMLAIYLLAQVLEDMNTRGFQQIKRETEQKSAIIYQALEDCNYLRPFVTKKECRSKTTIVAELEEPGDQPSLLKFLDEKGIVVSTGYGNNKGNQIRIANFPAHSKENVERLADLLLEFRR